MHRCNTNPGHSFRALFPDFSKFRPDETVKCKQAPVVLTKILHVDANSQLLVFDAS